jgi:hypothetical protein
VPLISGREFTTSDTEGAPRVAIVNETFAKKFGLDREPVGKLMSAGGDDWALNIEIVGLVPDTKYADVKQEVPPVFMLPWRQQPSATSMSFYLRTETDAEAMLGTVRTVMRQVDPALPVEDLRTLPQQVRENVFLDRMMSVLVSAFASLAFTVSQRTREFGLRMALGAGPGRVRGLVLRQVAWLIMAGTLAGLGFAIAIGAFAKSLLFELETYDPVALGASAILLATVALGAGFIPAYRASRIDPMRALHYE